MTPGEAAGLQALARALRAEAEALELLAATPGQSESEAQPAADLTVAEVAERFHRRPSTIRGWISVGRLRAYSFGGREHRVTPVALQEFEAAERSRAAGEPRKRRLGRSKTVDLGSWRKVAAS